MYTPSFISTPLVRLLLVAAFALFAAVSGFAQSKSPDKPTPPAPVQLKYEGAPQGTTLADQVARAEFYKAQYPNDAATQAKYQAAIDDFKNGGITKPQLDAQPVRITQKQAQPIEAQPATAQQTAERQKKEAEKASRKQQNQSAVNISPIATNPPKE